MKKRSKNTETRTMVLVFMTVFIGWIGFSLPYPVFSHLFLDLDGSLLANDTSPQARTLLLGAAIAVYPLGQIIGAPLFGHWSDRIGRKPVLKAALLTAVAGGAFLAAGVSADSLPLLFLGRFVAGLGEGNIAIVQSLAADVSSPESKARNFAVIGIAMDLGFVVGPVLGGVLADPSLSEAFGFAFPFWTAAGLFALNALVVPLFLNSGTRTNPSCVTEPTPPLVRAVSDPLIVRLLVLSFLTYWAVMIFFDFFPVFFVQLYDTPPRELGINAALLSLPLILSGLVVGRIVTRYGPGTTAAASFVLLFIGIALFVRATSQTGHILPAILVSIGINFGQTATSVLVSDAASKAQQGQILGLYRAITVLAGGLAAAVGGYFASLSPQAPFMTALAAAGMGLVMLMVMSKKARRAKA
ncbi:MFS transporter [Pelagibius sp. Alg239-R121]|uniref:MFS transporter n=1 Tax=Pelagibius sp. Alg239-R121 TaxID=2993448 RepID=UPI0024A6D165|nr:MFS transporter [Pelagibius sp. Alg239-R121]